MGDLSLTSSASAAPVEFTCNICGTSNRCAAIDFGRELKSCSACGSNVRTRAIVHMISRELFGCALALPDFPVLKGVRGIGISDSHDYASRLETRFTYTNTHYHKEPSLDIARVPETEFGKYDFLIASEVLEHVAPPVETAFNNAFRLLKPNGLFFFTVPYTLSGQTAEHFPELNDYGIAQLSTGMVLVNRTRDGQLQTFDNLVFHGGAGSTLEIRQFTEGDLRRHFQQAGFRDLQVYGENYLPFGILHHETWSLPMAARKQPFSLNLDCTAELLEESVKTRKWLESEVLAWKNLMASKIPEYDEWVARANTRITELENTVAERSQWAMDQERQLGERTTWALSLQKDLAEHVELAKRFQAEAQERTEWALNLQREIDELQSRLARLHASPWTRLGRALRVLKAES